MFLSQSNIRGRRRKNEGGGGVTLEEGEGSRIVEEGARKMKFD